VDLALVSLEAAPPNDRLYANKLLGFQVTGGSSSIRATWEPLRRAGATARVMLVTAAAREWNVDPASCDAKHGTVIHSESGRKQPYTALIDVAATLPVPADVTLKGSKQFKLIGTPAKRLDTPDKVNGKAVFGIDVRLPGMKIAAVAACPVIGGRLIRADDGRASKVAGVRQVVRLDDAVAVVADHMWAAKLGLAALDIDWDEGPNAKLSSADIIRQMDMASRKPGVAARQEGDVHKAMTNAAMTYAAIYELPFLAHATMEPMNCTVYVRPDGCDVWVGTQVITRAQATAVAVTGLSPEKVQVHNHYLGGGFGRRLEVDFITQAVQIGQQVNGPVKVVWTREDDIRHDIYRPYYFDRIAAGLDDRGQPVAWSHRVTGSSIMARWIPAAFKNGLDADAVQGAAEDLLYAVPNILVDYVRNEPPFGLTAALFGQITLRNGRIWNALFNPDERIRPNIGQTPEWNRGAYLVEALGHCDDCHTPRNFMMASDFRRKLGGAMIDGWKAYNISSDAEWGIGAWSEAQLMEYLSVGHAEKRSSAGGPMAEVLDDSLRFGRP
jgi:isoquinoline 1-oxidoreductase beta subunit